jgi:hypothetical protein
MLSLFVGTTQVELYQDENVTLTKQVKSVQDVKAKSDFTQSFTIPASDNNNSIFDHYYDISIVGGYNAHVKVDATIEVHGLQLFEGVIELLGVTFKDNQPHDYSIVFYGDIKSLASTFGEQTLKDVDLSAYDHTLNQTNVVNSWADNLFSGVIKYPIWDHSEGVMYGNTNVDIPHNIAITGRGLAIDELRPAIKLKNLFEKCITHAGFTLTGTNLFSDSYFDDLMLLPVEKAGYLHDPAIKTNNNFAATATAQPTGITPQRFTIQTYSAESSDPNSNFVHTTGIYTAPLEGRYTFTFAFDLTARPSFSTATYLVVALKNGRRFHDIADTRSIASHTSTFMVYLQAGDTIRIGVAAQDTFTADSISFSCTESPYSRGGRTIKMQDTMPPVKIVDFIQGVLTTFNAVLYREDINSTNYIIKNADTWYDGGSTQDWTEYVDISTITHKKVKIPSKVSFQYKEMNDMASKAFFDRNQRHFGGMSYSPDVDFPDAPLEVKSPFSVVVPQRLNKVNKDYEVVGTTSLPIPILLDDSLAPSCNDMVLFFMDATETASSDAYFAAGASRTTYPYAGTMQKEAATDGFSLAFSLEQNLGEKVPTDTLYRKFWERHIARLFAKSSRKISIKAYLPVAEWINLELENTIRIADFYYKIESMQYNINTSEAQLELFTYEPVTITSPTTSSTGAVTLPTNYITPTEENFAFPTRTQATLNNIISIGTDNFVQTGLPSLTGGSRKNIFSNAAAHGLIEDRNNVRYCEIGKNSATESVTTTYAILTSFTAASTNQVGTGLTPVAENGTIETDAGEFVSIVASVNYSGADPLDIAIMLNEVALKEFSSATANSVSLTTTAPTNSGGLISLAVKKPSGSGSTNYTITCNLSVQIL